ncbi:MAG: hypothetical protein JSV24_11055 [Bacteroidales bacterium]|nr:MAG: hypothetical protein JSV24_11055 [Bacteroidales bacterium]
MEDKIKALEEVLEELTKEIIRLNEFKAEALKFIQESLTFSKQTSNTLVKHAESMEQLRTANGKIIRTISEISTIIRK